MPHQRRRLEVRKLDLLDELLSVRWRERQSGALSIGSRTHVPAQRVNFTVDVMLQVRDKYLDGFGIKFKPLLFIDQEFLDIFALITLKLDHLAHLSVIDNCSITSYTETQVSADLSLNRMMTYQISS